MALAGKTIPAGEHAVPGGDGFQPWMEAGAFFRHPVEPEKFGGLHQFAAHQKIRGDHVHGPAALQQPLHRGGHAESEFPVHHRSRPVLARPCFRRAFQQPAGRNHWHSVLLVCRFEGWGRGCRAIRQEERMKSFHARFKIKHGAVQGHLHLQVGQQILVIVAKAVEFDPGVHRFAKQGGHAAEGSPGFMEGDPVSGAGQGRGGLATGGSAPDHQHRQGRGHGRRNG